MYRDTLAENYRVLLNRFRFNDFAVKVVGVGSIGTMCLLSLFMAADNGPLFLSSSETGQRLCAGTLHGEKSYSNHGQRVVMDQRLMQTASDMMLGLDGGSAGRPPLLPAAAPPCED
jgi:hypothetical protein